MLFFDWFCCRIFRESDNEREKQKNVEIMALTI